MHTEAYARVHDRLLRLSGADLTAVARKAGVGRSTAYRIRNGAPGAPVNVRDSTVARLEHALQEHAGW
jgi:DNA-binding LacI/PurR family transcriptional regulator